MDKRTPNKRKFVANAKATPNKIQKITHTPVSQNINKKSANQVIQKQNNGHTSAKTANKNQKKLMNDKQITLKGSKRNKQIEDDKTEFMDESDNSMDEPIGNGNNSDDTADSEVVEEANSDEEAEVDEGNSDEDAEVDEADSEDKVEVVEADSDEEAEVDEANSDENAEIDEEANSNGEAEIDEADSDEQAANKDDADKVENKHDFSVFFKGFFEAEDVFRDCKIKSVKLLRHPITNNFLGKSIVHFEDHESMMKALEKNQKEYNGQIITVYSRKKINIKSELWVWVKGMPRGIIFENIFSDCKIDTIKILKDKKKSKYVGRALISFKDTESVKNALVKNGTFINGHLISVQQAEKKKQTKFCVVVKGLQENTKVEDIFNDCKIHWINLRRYNKSNVLFGSTFVYFEDKESVQKALTKNGTEFYGKTIFVELPRWKLANRKSEHKRYTEPYRKYPRHNPAEFMQKKILYDALKSQTEKLERELFGNTKPYYKKKFNR